MAAKTRTGGTRKKNGNEGSEKKAAKRATKVPRNTRSGGVDKSISKEKAKTGTARSAIKKGASTHGVRSGAKTAEANEAPAAAQDYSQLTVVKLREALVARGLRRTGVKAALVQRLREADRQTESSEPAPIRSIGSRKSTSDSSVNYRNARQIKTLEELEADGWELAESIPRNLDLLCCSDTVGASRLPSPFSTGDQSTERDPLRHITEIHVSDKARNLYLILNPHYDEYEHRHDSEMREGFDQGYIGYLGELESDNSVKVTSYPSGNPHLSTTLLPLGQAKPIDTPKVGDAEAVFEAHCCHNQKMGKHGIFILNRQQSPFIVNESAYRDK